MLGAIIGDIVGSRFEWHNHKSKNFELFTDKCKPTDDSIMTLAIADAINACQGSYENLEKMTVRSMQAMGRTHPDAGYGGHFRLWIMSMNPKPYNSYGNGAAMRVSPCAHVAKSLEEAKKLSGTVTAVSHDHPEGIKGAEAVTVAIYMALHGKDKDAIRMEINDKYYKLDFTLDEIRPSYSFDETCQGTVPHAIEAFLESISFEDAIRNAISISGDSDTVAAITGGIAGAFYGIPKDIDSRSREYLKKPDQRILDEFESKFGVGLNDTSIK